MKAAQVTAYGGEAVLQTVDTDKPEATAGKVLVEVYAAGVNPFDWKVREGMVRQMAELTFPATLGGDVAGVVSEVGEGVTEFEVGQEVFGQAGALGGKGSYAEFTPVSKKSLALKPKNSSFVESVALSLAGVSAYQALVETLNVQSGQKVLIHGGAGGIGSLAIQLAKHLGASVTTTASASDVEFVKSLGANEVIDYQSQDFSTLLKDYDAVYDTVGGETNKKSYQVLKAGGVMVSMGEQPNEELMQQYGVTSTYQFTQVTTERLTKVAEFADAGVLKPTIDKIFPLDEASQALEYQKTGHPRGKVVIQVK